MKKDKTIVYFDELDEKLSALVAWLDTLDEDQLKKQRDQKWSVLQIMEHLKTSEGLAGSYIRYKISKGTLFKNSNIMSSIRSMMMVSRLRFPAKAKAPLIKGLSPDNENLDYTTIKDEWKMQRSAMKEYFKELDPNYFKKDIYKHPALGTMGLYHMLRFFKAHFDRHYKQIKKRAV